MEKENKFVIQGVVHESLPNATFRVTLDSGREVLAHVGGKLRVYHIRILPGDRVSVELPTEDSDRGRITYRFR